jgi:hypothetical protein
MPSIIYPILIDDTLYTPTWKDTLYNDLQQALYDDGKTKALTDKAVKWDQEGRLSDCVYEEILMYQALIEYLILARDLLSKDPSLTATEYAALKDTFDFNCIRNTFFCKFGSNKLFDELIAVANLGVGSSNQGLDFMLLEPTDDTGDNDFIII